MIVGTAGHIDHGKTALIKALTGTDADRLQLEKERGITLDLGFAYQHFDDGSAISYLDVPGHERLVRTMVAGASGISLVLFVVAADDGPMPQTREHLAILELLGVQSGAIVVTKIDRVSEHRLTEVSAEVRMLTQGTFLQGAPIFQCAAPLGVGISPLSDFLETQARRSCQNSPDGHFRLAVDRVFTLKGAGLVVTGTVHAGAVRNGDLLTLSPKGVEVRVRGIRAENAAHECARAGQRCALNLTGRRIEKEDIERGDWIVSSEIHAPTNRIDGRLTLVKDHGQDLAHWTPVHLHLGARDVTARVSLLDCKRLAPGQSGFCQLVLERPICALFGDRFIIRDQAASRTLGGGTIIDPYPPARNTRKPERLAVLQAADHDDPAGALRTMSDEAASGVDFNKFKITRNLTDSQCGALIQDPAIEVFKRGSDDFVLSRTRWQSLRDALLTAISDFQNAHLDAAGANVTELIRMFPDPKARILARARLEALIEKRDVERLGQLVHLPGHTVQLSPDDEVLWQDVERVLKGAGVDQPRVTVLAEMLDLRPDELLPALEKFARAGRINRVSKAYFLLQETLDAFIAKAERCAATHDTNLLTVGQFRDATAVTRHLVMPLLEYFDRIGFTRRYRVGRQIRDDWYTNRPAA